ncbi:MAG TPA: energy transducer TonB [Blastocatellia bacterium]|nr:energy transducer TonB [Blastocatellia bacterium]
MFDDMVVSRKMKRNHKPWAVVVSSAVQALLLGILVMIPLISYSELPKGFNATYLAAPPPPLAPAPPPVRASEQSRKPIPRNRLEAPNRVRKGAQIVQENEPTIDFSREGIPGGEGATDLLVGLVGPKDTAPPAPPKPPARIRVGGQVEAARLIHQTIPAYPAIARTAHIQGTVVLRAVIGKDGSITSIQYISGPALLMKAAEDAVSAWRYQPLVLNGEPIEVETEISVIFTLNE